MGADLYLYSLHNVCEEKYKPLFDKWVKTRDEATSDEAKDKAQKKVSFYYDAMMSDGYFRDSYNNSSLFWQYELSWWSDLGEMLDKEGYLAVDECKKLLAMLEENNETFEENVGKLDLEAREYFIKKDITFKNFLKQAIELDEPIYCSI